MKKFFILLLIFTSLFAFGQKLSNDQQENLMYQLVDQYYPDAGWMLRDLTSLPRKYNINGMNITSYGGDDPSFWIRGNTASDVVESLSTVIHESIHGYTSEKNYQFLAEHTPEGYTFRDNYSAYFIDKEEIILVKHTEGYNSNELKKDIPKDLRTFRYSPYIAPRSNLGSQQEGIYGLLDEFNAYYQGAKMVWLLLPYFEALDDPNEGFQDFVSEFSSDRLAFYEFTYFTLKYLIRSERTYAYEYKDIINNIPLRKAYTAVYQNFLALDMAFQEKLETKIEELKSIGLNARVSGEYFYIDGYGVGIQTEEINLLKRELEKSDDKQMLNNILLKD